MTTPPQNQAGATAGGARGSAGSSGSNGERTKADAKRLADDAKAQAKAGADKARDTAAHKAETLADSARAAARALEGDDIGHLSQYVSDLADGMTRFAHGLRNKSGDEIAHDIGRIARENPALFVAGSVAVGFGLSRFARASRHESHALVPQADARPGIDLAQGRTTTDHTVYRAGSLHESDAPAGSRSKGGTH